MATPTIWNYDPGDTAIPGRRLSTGSRGPRSSRWRLAADLMRLEPNSLEARRLYSDEFARIGGNFASGSMRRCRPAPVRNTATAAKFGVDAVNDALAQALATGHPAAAQAAARVLQGIGSAAILTRRCTAGLARWSLALRSNERRLRFAAAAAIMSFKPNAPFPGSSYLTDAAADLATSTGHRRAVIGFPTVPTAQQLAGLAAASGYDPQTATNGFGVFAAATQSADTEIVFVSGRIARPDAFDLIQQFTTIREPPMCRCASWASWPIMQLQSKRFATEPNSVCRLSAREAGGNGRGDGEGGATFGRPRYSAAAAIATSGRGARLAGGDGTDAAGSVRRAAI